MVEFEGVGKRVGESGTGVGAIVGSAGGVNPVLRVIGSGFVANERSTTIWFCSELYDMSLKLKNELLAIPYKQSPFS